MASHYKQIFRTAGSSKRIQSHLVLAFILCSLLFSWERPAAGADPDDFWKFYEKHPHMQDYFPFGVYGGAQGNWTPWGHSPQAYTRILTGRMAENGFNVIWGGKTPFAIQEDEGGPLVPAPFNRWFYGHELPLKEIKIFPTLINYMRFNNGILAKFQREAPPLNAAELAEVEEDRKDFLEFAGNLGKKYPESIIGFISDDEPLHLAPGIAAIRLIEKYTQLPVTTCKPSWGGFKRFVGHMQPMTADWYPTWDATRDSWSIAKNLRWLRENHPDRIFYFIPLAAAWSVHEPTKPWLKDSRPSRTELRMQFWQALAWGTKGFFYFHVGGPVIQPQWAGGQDGLLNYLLWPNDELWDELGSIGKMITTIGPLLISCRPDVSMPLEVFSGQVHYPEFEGPAIDYGLLKCIKNDRYFLIPWNNSPDRQQSGTLLFSEAILNGRKVYDLINLREVALENEDGKQGVALTLPPGGGQIFLIANAEEFELCRQTILRHRVRHPRIVARMHHQIAETNGLNLKRPENVTGLLEAAQEAESGHNWVKAAELYQQATNAIRKNEEALPNRVHDARAHLDRVAKILTQTEDLFRTHTRVLDLSSSSSLYAAHGTNKYAGHEIREWAGLTNMYLDALIRSREGTHRAALSLAFLNTVLTLEDLVEKNHQAVKAAIEKRLGEIRQPIKLAFITPDRNEVGYHMLQSWAYENTSPTWIAPDGKGKLTDEKGTPVNLSDYDVVWIHQLRYAQPVPAGETVDPMQALMPELVNEQTVQAMKEYVNHGGGLFLSGISGIYALSLGIEKTMPNRLRENGFMLKNLSIGLIPATGFEKHPVFDGLAQDGFFTNGNWPEMNLVSECAWESKIPSGFTVANELDQTYGRVPGYAAIVEYRLGKGAVIVFGGKSCDFTPGLEFSLPKGNHRSALRRRTRQIALNTLSYLVSEKQFESDPAAIAKVSKKDERIYLPVHDWLFRTDPENIGMKKRWDRPGFDTGSWKPIPIGVNWESHGYDYDGYAWYRRTFTAANKPGSRAVLHFGAVDEEAVVYIDGKLAGKHQEGVEGWRKPFEFDITDFLTSSPEEHLIAVQVFDSTAAGGIWKPVFISYE